MAISLRQVATCIGLPASFSVRREFYGFWLGTIPTVTGGTATLSLRQQLGLLRGPHIHLDVIRVGAVDADDDATIDAAVHVCRTVYATVGLGVGRVRRFGISVAAAAGRDVIDSATEKNALLGAWTAASPGIDVFMVTDITYDGVVGSAGYIPANCGDRPASDRDGVIVDVNETPAGVARTFAHEVGHFLGLAHTCGTTSGTPPCAAPCQTTNLMTQTGCAAGSALVMTASQGAKMRCHFMVRPGC
jgi:hypothetical protein